LNFRGHKLTLEVIQMPLNKKLVEQVDKIIDFGRKLFAGVLRSRTGALTELSRLLRFQKGTKGFEREYNRLVPLMNELKGAYRKSVLELFPSVGLRFGIIDDSGVKKTGKNFPKQKIQHDHTSNTFYTGMKVLSSAVYQAGKVAAISSRIMGEEDNKLIAAQEEIDMLIDEYFVDLFLFDSWYCKSPVLEKVEERGKIFISRLRTDSKVDMSDEQFINLNHLAKNIAHKEYKRIKIRGKTYWVHELTLKFKTYGTLRVIISKEGQHEEPIFLTTNTEKFTPKFIVKLYLKRFSIEIFFKDAKQFLNFETFLCRKPNKWDIHLHLTNVLHWAIQKKNSISKTVRAIREDISKCQLFINENRLITKFTDELRKLCQT